MGQTTSEQGRLDRVHHVAIEVRDIRVAVDWYRHRFRCRVAWQDETWALLQFENTSLALVLPEEHPAHVAFERSDAAAFGPLQPHRDGTSSCYFEDPFGNAVEALRPGGGRE